MQKLKLGLMSLFLLTLSTACNHTKVRLDPDLFKERTCTDIKLIEEPKNRDLADAYIDCRSELEKANNVLQEIKILVED